MFYAAVGHITQKNALIVAGRETVTISLGATLQEIRAFA
jgi:hypothetical protein